MPAFGFTFVFDMQDEQRMPPWGYKGPIPHTTYHKSKKAPTGLSHIYYEMASMCNQKNNNYKLATYVIK